jgi:CHAD domain-containing protein
MGRTKQPQVSTSADVQLPPEPIPVCKDDPVQHQIRAGLDAYVRAMLAHAPGTRLGADPEELHQMRVTVRKMRALLKTGRLFLDPQWSQPVRAELGWLGDTLGSVRDLDVLLDRLRRQAEGFDEAERAAFARLTSGLEQERSRYRKKLVAALDSDRYAKLVDRLVAGIQAPPPASATDSQVALRDIVTAQFRKLSKQVQQAGSGASDTQLHALRIQGKRLRYAGELVSSSNRRAQRLVAACKRFQDVLGEHQDACVATERIVGLLAELGDRADNTVAFVAGRLVEREALQRAACRDQWWKCWLDVRERAEKWTS